VRLPSTTWRHVHIKTPPVRETQVCEDRGGAQPSQVPIPYTSLHSLSSLPIPVLHYHPTLSLPPSGPSNPARRSVERCTISEQGSATKAVLAYLEPKKPAWWQGFRFFLFHYLCRDFRRGAGNTPSESFYATTKRSAIRSTKRGFYISYKNEYVLFDAKISSAISFTTVEDHGLGRHDRVSKYENGVWLTGDFLVVNKKHN